MEPADEATQQVPSPLDDLTPEETQSDLYITAIHELNRRRKAWSSQRLHRIATDLNLDPGLLHLTWCLLQATERSRQRAPAVRLGIEKSYLRFLHGGQSETPPDERLHLRISREGFRQATEALLAAGSSMLHSRQRVAAMLEGRQMEMRMREDAEYEDDVSLSSEEGNESLAGICERAVGQLPGAGDLRPDVVSNVAAKLTTLAETVINQGEEAVPENVLRRSKYRTEVLRWMNITGNSSKTLKRRRAMAEAIDEIADESGVRLHPMARRALLDAFVDEASLAEGGLHAFRALVPAKVGKVVRQRELGRLIGWMKTADQRVAEQLLESFGSARRCLRAGEEEIREIAGEECRRVMEIVHGYDEELHEVLKEVTPRVWLVSRVVKDKCGGLSSARRKRFGEFMECGAEVVELSCDERLQAYCGVHGGSTGEDREQYEFSWGLFQTICVQTKVKDCLTATVALLEWDNTNGASDLSKVDDLELWSICQPHGFDSDEVLRISAYMLNFREVRGPPRQ